MQSVDPLCSLPQGSVHRRFGWEDKGFTSFSLILHFVFPRILCQGTWSVAYISVQPGPFHGFRQMCKHLCLPLYYHMEYFQPSQTSDALLLPFPAALEDTPLSTTSSFSFQDCCMVGILSRETFLLGFLRLDKHTYGSGVTFVAGQATPFVTRFPLCGCVAVCIWAPSKGCLGCFQVFYR